ncbi:MAG: metallophosphoesterase [candidate division KSB1 bacterium]|nr:metallophosphoesterase [candidate division KSB1 bacterium]
MQTGRRTMPETCRTGTIWWKTLIVVAIGLTLSCRPPASRLIEKADFKAIVLSDTHISSDTTKTRRLLRLVQKINAGKFPGVELVFVTGDVVSSVFGKYTHENPDTSDNRLRRAVSVLRRLRIPFYLAMGNHDHKIGNFRDSDAPWPQEEIGAMWELWRQQTGFAPYYSVKHRGWKFIVLNSMGGRHLNRHFDDTQMDWLGRELEENGPVALLFHHPIKTDHFRFWCKFKDLGSPQKDRRFYRLLRRYQAKIKGVFVGHGHLFVHDVLFGRIPVFETDSFGEGSDESFYIVSFNAQKQTLRVIKANETVNVN